MIKITNFGEPQQGKYESLEFGIFLSESGPGEESTLKISDSLEKNFLRNSRCKMTLKIIKMVKKIDKGTYFGVFRILSTAQISTTDGYDSTHFCAQKWHQI